MGSDLVAQAMERLWEASGAVKGPGRKRAKVLTKPEPGAEITVEDLKTATSVRQAAMDSLRDVSRETSEPSLFDQYRRKGHWAPTGWDGRRKPHRDFESLGSVLGREIEKRGWAPNIARGWISNNWRQLVGDYIGAHSEVVMFKDQTLFIQCDSTAKTNELRLLQSKILETIAAKVGDGIVTQLKIYPPAAPSWRHGKFHVKGRGPRDTYG